jgi:hypothetical protein
MAIGLLSDAHILRAKLGTGENMANTDFSKTS